MRILFFYFLLCLISQTACQSSAEESASPIMTVTGEVFSSGIDTTLIHEHILVDWIGADSTGYHRWNRAEVIERLLPYLKQASDQGVQTILECTPAYLGRDPLMLQELSRRSNIQFVTNTGYYGAVDNRFLPDHVQKETAEELSNRWIDEFKNGIEDTDIRPGFIKISVKGNSPLSELHTKIIQAAALTHLETGMTIVSHTNGDKPALAQLEVLKELNVSPAAWVWTHAQSGTLDAQLEIASSGGWISLDNVRTASSDDDDPIDWYVQRIMDIKEAGRLNRLLISHDAGYYNPDEPNGGDIRGFTDIFEHLIPALQNEGFSEDEIEQLLVQNPRNAYGINIRTN